MIIILNISIFYHTSLSIISIYHICLSLSKCLYIYILSIIFITQSYESLYHTYIIYIYHIYQSYLTINHTYLGGSLILSDDLKQISNKRFRIMLQLLPPTNQAAIVVDLLGILLLLSLSSSS